MPKKKIENEDKPAVLTKLKVKGFKCFRDETEIEIKPLTVLAGANSSGKTSIMQPLLLMKQTSLSNIDPPDDLLLEGPNIEFSDVDQLFWNSTDNGKTTDFMVGLTDSDGNIVNQYFNRDDKKKLSTGKLEYGKKGKIKTIQIGMNSDELRELFPNINILEKSSFNEFKEEITFKIIRKSFYVGIIALTKEGKKGHIIGLPQYPLSQFGFIFERILHLPGLRGNPERIYKKTGTLYFLGQFNNYTASVISNWNNADLADYNDNQVKIERLNTYLRVLSLGSSIIVENINRLQISLYIEQRFNNKKITSQKINIADVGFGVSQVLPVLVALLEAEPGQIVYIEQPEIHLHPKAQVLLAEIIAEASKRGVIVILETHSDMLLLGIRRVVAKGKLDPSLVSLNWFKRDKKTGAAKVTKGKMNEKGAVGNWPEDFSAVSMKYESEYLDMVL